MTQGKINKVILHVTATPATALWENIRRNHIAQGWKDIGYHHGVDQFGKKYAGRPETQRGAHAAANGGNINSIGIACITRGNDIRSNDPYGTYLTTAQMKALEELTADILRRHKLTTDALYGHNDFDKGKACPCFKVRTSQVFLSNVNALLKGEPAKQEYFVFDISKSDEIAKLFNATSEEVAYWIKQGVELGILKAA